MKFLPFFILCPLLPVQGAVIFTELSFGPPGPPAPRVMLDFDQNGSVDLGFRARAGIGNSYLFEVLISDNTSVVRLGETNSSFGSNGTFLAEGFQVDSLEGQPLYSYRENTSVDPDEMTNFAIASLNGFANSGEGDFFEKRGYLGFRFEGADGPHYGYVHIDGRQVLDFSILSYAYESEPNTPILTGAIPEPTTAILLMLLPSFALRRKRQS